MGESESNGEKVLTGVLAEFRTALREEIEAARRATSDRAVPLLDGKRIAQVGGEFQYVFVIENALSVPSDTPGELVVAGGERMRVTILSIEGLLITLSVAKDMGPAVPSARLVTNLTFLMQKLIERIEAKADTSNTGGERILSGTYSGEPAEGVEFRREDLNAGQRGAVCASLGRNTTFIWGPPGTGKTYTIGEIGEQLYRAGRSLLVISHTNTAVDTAIVQIAEKFLDDELAKGEIIRVGVTTAPKVCRKPNLLLQTHVDKRAEELARRREALEQERCLARERMTRLGRLLEIAEWISVAGRDIEVMYSEWERVQALETELEECRERLRQLEQEDAYWQDAEKEARIAAGTERKMMDLRRREGTLEEKRGELEKDLALCRGELAEARRVLAEASSVGWLTRKWRRLPSPEEQRGVVESIEVKEHAKDEQVRSVYEELETVRGRRAQCEEALAQFQNKYGGTPSEVLERARDHRQKKVGALAQSDELRREHLRRIGALSQDLCARLLSLCAFGLAGSPGETVGEMLGQVREAYERAKAMVEGEDIEAIRREVEEGNEAIVRMSAELETIEEELKRVEETIIREARVVATTLTRAYLRDSIQGREFDTVLLDEASMAPIPALWVAASLATNNVVVVGDFKQLPPIVLSRQKDGCAQKWLGRDIFEVAGITDDLSHPCLITLREQHRMHPEISVIANRLVYENQLTDADGAGEGDKESPPLDKWYRTDWGHDTPVLLIDTGCLNAWVTSVPRERGSSRLNFLSAALCVELVGQLLKIDRPAHNDGEEPRILLVSPYRPHAKLSEFLVRETLKGREVVAGTVHSFQGSEADVVILDLVNDEPHWKVGMFMPESDKQTCRLLNVAVTRAKKRLIVVGDLTYIGRLAKKNFLGSKFIPFLLERYPRVEALEVVQTGLAAKAAAAQVAVAGGPILSDAERLITTSRDFYRFLAGDVQRARQRIVIYSAFMTQQRLSEVGPHLAAAVERGVRVYIITKTMGERKKEKGVYKRLEDYLRASGITIVHKEGMHEKLVFVDDSILWEGSLNVLSAGQSGEHMERRLSKEIVDDYAKTIRLKELLCEYEGKVPACPVCGSEIVATEGKDEPFYWRCIKKDCYTRSIDEDNTTEGAGRCRKCGGEVEFGVWGRRPVWRCVRNRKHRTPVRRWHLKVPEMRGKVPNREFRKLEKWFGLERGGKDNGEGKSERMGYLFDF